MYLWGAFPFLRFALALTAGIVAADTFLASESFENATWIVAFLFIAILSLSVFGRESFRAFQGFLSLCLLVCIGSGLVHLHRQTNHSNHYSHFESVASFRATLISDATERKDYFRYEAEVRELMTDSGTYGTIGKIHFYQRKTDQAEPLKYGDEVIVKGGILPVPAPKNPHEFDYKRYLENQNIYGHVFLSPEEYRVTGNDPPNLLMKCGMQARERGIAIIGLAIPNPREQAILEALLLGVKDHLDNEIKEAYSAAGAMHVLAVSGLHVGIVFIVLGTLLGFLKKTRSGKFVFVILSLLCIWIYALITGFSASVLRAVIMFSVILISGNLGKQAYIYNSLGIAALILLLYDPFLIYSVGFQLSFVAVFGIVYLHPILHELWEAPNKTVDYIWSITCVSIAAQVATFPLTMLYFHQFPTYFMVSNLLVIPASFVILIGGIAMLILGSIWSFLGIFIGTVVFWMVWVVNEGLLLLTRLPYPLFDWLYFDLKDTLLVYLVLIFMAVAFSTRKRVPFVAGLTTLLIWTCWTSFGQWERSMVRKVVIYEIKDRTAIDLIEGTTSTLLIDSLSHEELELIGFQINPNRLASGLKPVDTSIELISQSPHAMMMPGGSIIYWNGYKILIMKDRKAINEDQLETADLILLNTPKAWELPRKPVVIGTRMRFYQQKKLKEKLADAHSLSMDGYYQVSL